MPLLEIENLRAVFEMEGAVARAADGVALDVEPGETVGLVGESGCGKSVTCLSVLRLVPAPGRILPGSAIRFDGRDLLALPEREMRRIRGNRIAMIFQEPLTCLNPVLRVGDQVAEVVATHRRAAPAEAWARAVEMLRLVGLPDPERAARAYPHELSGGMRQRATIAMALACEPRLLLADEPTTALDVTVQAQILDLLGSLQRRLGMAVLLVTHDLGVVAEVARRVFVMYAGHIVEAGPVEAIFGRPRHPYTEGLLRSRPPLDRRPRRLPVLPGTVPAATEWPLGCRFHPRCPHAWERCRAEAPPEFQAGPGHRVRCWLEAYPERRTDTSARPLATGGAGSAGRARDPSLRVGADLPERRESAGPPATEPTPAPLLEVRDLAKHYPIRHGLLGRARGVVRAVDGVSLRVGIRETLALVGESGSGKTTTGRAILRLVEPTAGTVRFDGLDVRALEGPALRAFRRRAQMVFQDPFASLNPRMTVGAALTEAMRAHELAEGAEAERRARDLLEIVGLRPEHARRYPHEFSGGQRQRIGIARALALRPELVIADEPVSALDVSVQAQILNLLLDLQEEFGLTYLLIAHDLGVVRALSDRVAVLYLGRIVEQAPADDLFREPLHPYTRALLSAVPAARPGAGRDRIVLPGDPPSPTRPPTGCPFHPRCPHPEKDDECRTLRPPLAEVAPGRWTACWKVKAAQGIPRRGNS